MSVSSDTSTSAWARLEASGALLTGVCLPDEARALMLSQPGRALLLGPGEEAHYRRLRTDKRRLDWLAGRAAAKRALRRFFLESSGQETDPHGLELASDAQGAPVCAAPGSPSFSISHCAAGGLCAVARGGRLVGVDWEVIAARARGLARLFARPGELPPGQEDDARLQTRCWAAKEAVLKLLGLGLACPPRDVETGPGPLLLHGRALQRWTELGCPRLALTVTDDEASVVAAAYTGD